MIAANLAQVQQRIEQAARRANRNPREITLVGVSKHRPVEAMLAAYRAGLRHFGENRVEEIEAKIPAFLSRLEGDRPEIHMIGHLQSRKVPAVLPHAQMIHSVDSLKLARRINRIAERDGHNPVPILLECNVSGEAAKAGFALDRRQTGATGRDSFFQAVAEMAAMSHVVVSGLMTMAPIVPRAEETRPYFRSLRLLMAACAEAFPQISWQHLSMGMTDDFEIAVEEGATLVRVGRAIFAE